MSTLMAPTPVQLCEITCYAAEAWRMLDMLKSVASPHIGEGTAVGLGNAIGAVERLQRELREQSC